MLVVVSVLLFCVSLQLTGFGVHSERLEASEAQQIALESENDQLLAPTSSQLVQNIQNDLKLIRSKYPEVADVVHEGKWAPGVIFATVSDDQISKINASEYGPIINIQRYTIITDVVLTFEQLFNPEVLGKRLENVYGISTSPNGISGRSHIITYDIGNSTYRFEKGSGDCPSGCIQRQWWNFQVTREPPTVALTGSGNNGQMSEDY